ncbi:MAG: hypothetical protein SH857_15720 [Chitinophagales bacterium]|nr:hypothetical protein [Chitinophagales bacterium]
MFTIDKVLDEIMQLDFSSREMLIDIVRKRQIEEKRKQIASYAHKAKAALKRGKLKAVSAAKLSMHLKTL